MGFVVCFSFLLSSFSPDLNYFFPFTGSGFDSSYLSEMLECVTKFSLTAFMRGLIALPFVLDCLLCYLTGFGWHTMLGVCTFSIVMSSFLTSFGLKSGFCFSLDIRTQTPLGIPFPYFTRDSDFLLRRCALLGGDEEISFFNTF